MYHNKIYCDPQLSPLLMLLYETHCLNIPYLHPISWTCAGTSILYAIWPVYLIYWYSILVFLPSKWSQISSEPSCTPASASCCEKWYLDNDIRVCFCGCVWATQSPWIHSHPITTAPVTSAWHGLSWGLSALQLETPVASTVSKHPRQHLPSSCQPPHLLGRLMMRHEIFPSSQPSFSSFTCLLPLCQFPFPLEASLSTAAGALSAPLQALLLCRWTYFIAPCTNTHSRMLTNRSRAIEWNSCQGD